MRVQGRWRIWDRRCGGGGEKYTRGTFTFNGEMNWDAKSPLQKAGTTLRRKAAGLRGLRPALQGRPAEAGWDALKRTPTTSVAGSAGVGAGLDWQCGGAGVQVQGGAGYLGGFVA